MIFNILKLQFLVIISYDLWFYFSHIILHMNFFKKIHKIHHSKNYKKLIFFDANKAHLIENILQILGAFIPLIFLDINIYLFINTCILIYFRDLLRHDYRIINIVGNHHILHHKYPKYNYGEYWLDRLFCTKYPNENEYIYGYFYL